MTQALGSFWPFGQLGFLERLYVDWIRRMPATARRLQQQEATLQQIAAWQKRTGVRIPKSSGLDLGGAFRSHEKSKRAYAVILDATVNAYADATREGKIEPSDVRFKKVFKDGSMEGLGAVSWLVVVVIGAVAASLLWQAIEEVSEVVLAVGFNTRQMKLLDAWLAFAARFMKQNPSAPPPDPPSVFGPPASDSGDGPLSVLGNIGPLISIGVGLWVLSMLPKARS